MRVSANDSPPKKPAIPRPRADIPIGTLSNCAGERRAPIPAPAARMPPNTARPLSDTPVKAPIKFCINVDNLEPSKPC